MSKLNILFWFVLLGLAIYIYCFKYNIYFITIILSIGGAAITISENKDLEKVSQE